MALAPGTRLGPYRIRAPIGAGGMGEVYRARDEKLDRDIAIKVLPESVAADADMLARFEREAKAVAALSHPNILSIFDFGTHDGIVYAVTELLEGETLRDKLLAGPIPQRQALDYAIQIARGLAAAHERAIVHRDLKPENVFVTRGGHVKILDFGLAKKVVSLPAAAETSAPTLHEWTKPGMVMGTMGYMSPEQVRGLAVDHRSDLFAFGTLLYELLSGQRAFRRGTPGDTIVAILSEDPPDLSASGRNISPALARVVRHCLEKDRDDRFQSAKDIAFALSEASSESSSGFPTGTLRPPSTKGPASEAHPSAGSAGPPSGTTVEAPAAKKRIPAAALAAVVVILLAGAALVVVPLLRRVPATAGEARRVDRLAVLPFENLGAREDDYFADGIADEIRGKLTALPGVEVIARASSLSYRDTKQTQNEIAAELDVRYLLAATVRWQKAGGTSRVQVTPELVEVRRSEPPISKWQQSFDASLTDVFEVQSDIASRVAQSLGVALAAAEERRLLQQPTRQIDAYDAFLQGEEVWARLATGEPAGLREALGFYERAVALDPAFAQAWARIAQASSFLYMNSTPSPELAERAREAAEKAVARAPDRAEGYAALGDYQRVVRKDFEQALEQYSSGLRLVPGHGELLAVSALAESSLGRWEAAEEHFRQAERIDPRSVATMGRHAQVLVRLRRYHDARATIERGLALAPASPSLIQLEVLTFLGEGDLAGARTVLDAGMREIDPTILVAYIATYGDLVWVLDEPRRELLLRLPPSAFDDDRSAWALSLAQAYALAADETNLRAHAEEARKAIEEQLRGAPDDAPRHVLLGLALAYLGRKEEAIRQGERAVALLPIEKDAGTGPYLHHQLARILIVAGEPERALDTLEPLLRIPYPLSPGWLRIDPNFDPLRSHPRFQKLVAGP